MCLATRPVRASALLGVALVCALVALVGLAGGAAAAPAPGASPQRHAAQTNEVFVGSVINRLPRLPARPAQVYRLKIAQALDGELNSGQAISMTTTAKFRKCAVSRLPIARKQLYIFSIARAQRDYVADSCNDVQPVTERNLRAVKEKIAAQGGGQPPQTADPEQPPPVTFDERSVGEPTSFTRAAAPGLAIAIAALLGLVLVARLGRQRR